MGLGKTLIQIAISEVLLGDDEVSLNAYVVPASLKWQWAKAIAWATDVEKREISLKGQKMVVPSARQCVVIDGSPKRRAEQYRFARENRPDYVILGYENVINDWRDVRRLNPELICLDEATAIKSFSAERSKKIKLWRSTFRYALTGTPIDNRAEELYSIMEWVDPDELGRYDIFDKSFIVRDGYGRIIRCKNLDVLHKKTKKFTARKTRFDDDVSPYMPKDYHKDIQTRMSTKVDKLYKRVAAELLEDLDALSGYGGFDLAAHYRGEQSGGSEEQGRAASKMMVLSMLCCHPDLVIKSAKKFDDDFHAEKPVIGGSKYAWELWKDGDLDGLGASPKVNDIVDKVKDILEENDQAKVIIFSFYKEMLNILGREIGGRHVLYTGDMSLASKEAAKTQFQFDPNVRLFLSSDAGAYGVDLPQANWLINADPVWAAGRKDQRDNRHVRAGSEHKEVFVLNFMVEKSIEEWRYEVLRFKQELGAAILDGKKTASGGVLSNDVESLRAWLAQR